MQKALDQMNLQLHHVLASITGVSGLAILESIEQLPAQEPRTRSFDSFLWTPTRYVYTFLKTDRARSAMLILARLRLNDKVVK